MNYIWKIIYFISDINPRILFFIINFSKHYIFYHSFVILLILLIDCEGIKMEEKSKSIEVEFEIKNFGPLSNLKYKGKTNSLKMGIFANNGVGKTFFSRALRLASPLNSTVMSDNLLTTNEKNGNFIFKIQNQNDTIKTQRNLEIILEKKSKPIINNSTDYFFHVFNRDYVTENLESYSYRPDDNIQGYILGKSNIDVSIEKSKLSSLIKEEKKTNSKINKDIEEAKKDLEELGVRKNIKEYQLFDVKNLTNNISVKETRTFESLKKMQNKLESMPDDLKDISHPNYTINSHILEEVDELLSTAFTKSNLEKEFIKKVKSKQEFIETGMELFHSEDKKCPFCEQELKKQAINTIKLYNLYIKDSEAEVIKRINLMIKKLEQLKSDIKDHYSDYNEIIIKFNETKQYLPDHRKVELKYLNDKTVTSENINKLIDMLKFKKNDISSTDFKVEDIIREITYFLKQLQNDFKFDLNKIDSLNAEKNDKKLAKRELNRGLCKARYLILETKEKTNIQKTLNLKLEISDLEKDIKEKENKAKVDKKDKVTESLKSFLNYFFKDKYKFDEKTFSIIFKDEKLYKNATNVLSEGEKGIVAFCYYLATSHTIISKEDDYKNLFFVIDDPVSSMDFNFVYSVTDIISNLGKFFNHNRTRFIIFTHNLDFMNLLMGNNVTTENYILRGNDISRWNDKLMLPYENHLIDIIQIADGKEDPLHTTPNSIRHVLETICKFENRNKKMMNFIAENPELKNNGYIYSLMQDLSHGRVRSQALPDETIKNACDTVVKFVKKEYPGQIKGLNNYLGK